MKIGKFRSLAVQLTIWYVVILGVVIALAGAFLYQGYKTGLVQDTDKTLRDIADHVNEIWQEQGTTWQDAITRTEDEFRAQQPFIQVVALADVEKARLGTIIRATKVPSDAFIFAPEIYVKAERSDWETPLVLTAALKSLDDSPLRVVFLPVRGQTIVQVGMSLERVNAELNRLLLLLALAGTLLLTFASLGGSFIIRRALRPVQRVVRTAQLISADDLSLRIEAGDRKDEIGALVATFNDMLARLETSVKKIRQFSGDVSHELRTPLTVIRGEVEVILRKIRSAAEYHDTFVSVLDETHRMEKIIDDLLFLSRLDAGGAIELKQALALRDILEEVRVGREAAAQQKGITLRPGRTSLAPVHGDRALLERLMTNLVDNAIRYTPSGGGVVLELEETESQVLLTVRDTGIGIPAESLPYIFDRFYVVDPSRSKESGGSGLGLSIVKSIADLHGVTIDVQSKVGEGTMFILRFPKMEERSAPPPLDPARFDQSGNE